MTSPKESVSSGGLAFFAIEYLRQPEQNAAREVMHRTLRQNAKTVDAAPTANSTRPPTAVETKYIATASSQGSLVRWPVATDEKL
jgi:hypothetical protein